MDVQLLLVGGQALVVALVYVFVWRVIRTARRDLDAAARGATTSSGRGSDPQDSTIIAPADAQAARSRARSEGRVQPRIVVERSDVLRPGVPFTVGGGLTLGRDATRDVVLDESVVSGRHARIVPPGIVIDDGSTNGTLVNGRPVSGRSVLQDGDRVQVGSTVLRFEAGA